MRGDPELRDGDSTGRGRTVGRGPGAVFARLCTELSPALYAWAALRLRATLRGVFTAEDVVQEVWVRAARRLQDLDESTVIDVRGWLFGVARNVLLEIYREQRERRELPAGARTTLCRGIAECPDAVTSVASRLARHEGVTRLLELARTAGSEDDERLLVLCGLEGMTCSEAAIRLGLSEDAVTKRWQRLRARLRESEAVRALLWPGAPAGGTPD